MPPQRGQLIHSAAGQQAHVVGAADGNGPLRGAERVAVLSPGSCGWEAWRGARPWLVMSDF